MAVIKSRANLRQIERARQKIKDDMMKGHDPEIDDGKNRKLCDF